MTRSINRLSPSLRRWALVLFGFFVLLAGASLSARGAERRGAILATEIKDTIGVAATRLVADAITKARQENARYLVIHLDTPGGLVTATRDIIQHILSGRPEAMQLRYLGALQNIAGERSSTIVFPIPIDLFEMFGRTAAAKSGSYILGRRSR